MTKKIRIRLFIFWTAFVLFLLSIPFPEYNGTGFSWHDKVAHIVMFGIFTYLLAYALIMIQGLAKKRLIIYSTAAGIGYPALGEFIQKFVPGRTVSEYDFLAGIIGSVAAIIIFYVQYFSKKA